MKRRYIIIIIATLVICCAVVGLVVYKQKNEKGNKRSEEDATDTEIPCELPILIVTDFEDNKLSNKIEAVYSVGGKKTKLYKNGDYIGDSNLIADENIGLMEFNPEKHTDEINFTSSSIEKYSSGIAYTYNMDTKTSEYYISTLMSSKEYNIIRKVITPTYCEVYLKNNKGDILRVIVTSDLMVKANLKTGTGMKDIMSYFERAEVNVEDED